MATYEVQGPNGQVQEIEAPDMKSAIRAANGSPYTEAQLKAAARRALEDGNEASAKRLIDEARRVAAENAPETTVVDQFGSGINEGLAATAGAPVDTATAFINETPSLASKMNILGRIFAPDWYENTPVPEQLVNSETAIGGSAHLRGIMDPLISDVEPQNIDQKFARGLGREVGATAIPALGIASRAAKPAQVLMSAGSGAVGAQTAGQVAESAFPGNKAAQDTARILGGLGGAGVTGLVKDAGTRSAARKNYIASAPKSSTVKQAARAKYQEGHSLGLKIKPTATKQLAADIRGLAEKGGFITPTGRIAESSPEIRHALRMLEDASAGSVTTQQLQQVRASLQSVAQSHTPSVARTGAKMLNSYNRFIARFAPQFREGNALYAQAKRGEMVDTLEELADIRAAGYKSAPPEDALATEARMLDRKIAKGQMKGLRPDQVEAIQKASRGTRTSRNLRSLGRMAPNNWQSITSASLPAAAGWALGYPTLGAVVSGGAAGTGIFARALASAAQRSHANFAGASMRHAYPYKRPVTDTAPKGIIAALLGQAVPR